MRWYRMVDRLEDNDVFSDMYKEAHGFRPRDHEFFTADEDRRSELWDDLMQHLAWENSR